MKKILRGFAHVAIAMALCLPLFACAGSSASSDSNASALSDQISSTLGELKACQGEPFAVAEKVVAGSGIQEHLDDIGMTDEELCRAYLDDFDYEVGDVLVTGSSAEAQVVLRRRSIMAIVKSYVASGKMSDAAAAKDALLTIISDADTSEKSVTLYFTQSDGSWDVIDALSDALQRACL